MHISVRCPSCQTVYRLEANTRGKRTRCPNPICAKFFTIEAEDDGQSQPAPTNEVRSTGPLKPAQERKTGNVGDMLPLLPAEAVDDAPSVAKDIDGAANAPATPSAALGVPLLPAEMVSEPETSPEPVTWKAAPPVRRLSETSKAEPPKLEEQKPLPPPPEPMKTPAREKPAETPSWMAAPPPVRRGDSAPEAEKPPQPPPATPSRKHAQTVKVESPPAAPRTRAEEPKPSDAGPVELPPGAWEAPPVRRGVTSDATAIAPSAPIDEVAPDMVPVTRKRGPVFIAGMLLTLVMVVGAVIAVIVFWDDEVKRYARAKEAYDRAAYTLAAERFMALERDFPDSERRQLYEFLGDLSQKREQVYTLGADPAAGLQGLDGFLDARKDSPFLKEYGVDIGETFAKLADDFIDKAKQEHDAEALKQAERALSQAERFKATGLEARRKSLAEVRVSVARELRRRRLLDDLARLIDDPGTDPRGSAERLITEATRDLPGIRAATEVKDLLQKIDEVIRGRVVWQRGPDKPFLPVHEADDRSLVVTPSLVTNGRKLADRGRVVFALARGVLYALDQGSGRYRWATRVGIDTSELPVRLSATETSPEIALVLSSDTNTLTARDALTGRGLWRHQLSAPCLGRPLLVDRRAFVPTYDGKVHEIEIIEGKLLGSYPLQQPLTTGGVQREGTSLLYFAADERSVFVLDVAERRCVAVIPTDHPAGSLRCAPIIISRDEVRRSFQKRLNEDDWPDYLILNQADGLNAMKLRVFALASPDKKDKKDVPPAVEVNTDLGAIRRAGDTPALPGWAWFPPHHDGERLVQVTDAGVLGIVGIKQVRNEDRDLFVENKDDMSIADGPPRPGRAQVVDGVEDDFWVLAQGELRLWTFNRLTLKRKLVSRWPRPLQLGSPLQAGQVEAAGGRRALFVVTQALAQTTCLATAVDGANLHEGNILWQTQLGMLCQGEPLVLGPDVLVADRSGALVLFDSRKHEAGGDWQPAGELVANALDDSSGVFLVPGSNGTAYQVLSRPNQRLVVRRFETGKPMVERSFLHAGAVSKPAALTSGLVMALSDGKLLHVVLDDRRASAGPEWRARHADRDAPGFVVAVGGDDFLSTDGSRGLTRWRWAGGPMWEMLTSTTNLPERLIAAPVVIPQSDAGDELQVCVADARGTLTLLREKGPVKKRSWNAVRTWELKGRITAGPFLRGPHVGCVIDRERLVWIDPAKDGIAWEYNRPGDGIVGQPQQIDNMLVIAHQSGRFVGLDPVSGKRLGAGQVLKANVTPAAAPVAFGPGQAFVPLSDGTIYLLSLKGLRAAPVPAN